MVAAHLTSFYPSHTFPVLERAAASNWTTWPLSCLPHLDNTERPLLSPPPPPPRLTLREQQDVEENEEAVDVIKTLTTGNTHTAQAAVLLQTFILLFRLLGQGGYGPSLFPFRFFKPDQAV